MQAALLLSFAVTQSAAAAGDLGGSREPHAKHAAMAVAAPDASPASARAEAKRHAANAALRKKLGGPTFFSLGDDYLEIDAKSYEPADDAKWAARVREGWPALRCGDRELFLIPHWDDVGIRSFGRDTLFQVPVKGSLYVVDSARRQFASLPFFHAEGRWALGAKQFSLGDRLITAKAEGTLMTLGCGAFPNAQVSLETLYRLQRRLVVKSARKMMVFGQRWLVTWDVIGGRFLVWDPAPIEHEPLAHWADIAPVGIIDEQSGAAGQSEAFPDEEMDGHVLLWGSKNVRLVDYKPNKKSPWWPLWKN